MNLVRFGGGRVRGISGRGDTETEARCVFGMVEFISNAGAQGMG